MIRVIFIAAFLLYAVPAFATTYIVSLSTNSPAGNDGNPGTLAAPFATLQFCFNTVVAGDHCEIRAGTYNQGFLSVGVGHTALGTDFVSGQILVQPYNGEAAVLRHNSESTILTVYGTHEHIFWHFKDLDFDGSTGFYIGSGSSGSLIAGAGDYVWIDHCRVHHGVNVGLQPEGDYWTLLNLEVDHNGTVVNTEGIQYHGVYSGGSHIDINGGTYHENAGSAIQIFASGSNSVSFNTVRNLYSWGNDTYDANCGCYEISIGTGEGNVIYNVVADRFVIGAFQVDFRCGAFGVACAVYSSTAYSASVRTGIRVGPDNVGTILKNNILDIPSGTAVSNSGSMTVDSNNLKNTDPSFTNASTHDFTLQAGSVAIAYGADLSSLCTGAYIGICSDKNNVTRGSSFDAGAYQRSVGTPPSISGISPDRGFQGGLISVTVTGASTNFVNGASVCTISGSDIVIIGTTVSSATSAVCQFTVGSNATLGTRSITVTTGGEVVTAASAFTVALANSRQFQKFRVH